MAVVVCVIYIIGFERGGPLTTVSQPPSRALLPYQVLFRDLPSAEQRVFRSMQEGLGEALTVRGASGQWPPVGDLAAQGVPPFAADVLDKSHLRWDLRHSGLLHQYVALPAVAGEMPAFMISVLEPDPTIGEKPLPGSVDEEHQLLPGGVLLHITYWKRRAEGVGADAVSDPALAGWTQIRVKSPIEELMEER